MHFMTENATDETAVEKACQRISNGLNAKLLPQPQICQSKRDALADCACQAAESLDGVLSLLKGRALRSGEALNEEHA